MWFSLEIHMFLLKLNKYKVYKIINGRVYTDTVESVAIIDDNNIVDNVSYQQIVGDLVSSNKNIVLKLIRYHYNLMDYFYNQHYY